MTKQTRCRHIQLCNVIMKYQILAFSGTNHMRIKAFASANDSFDDITSGSVFYWRTGERKRAVICLKSYFSSSPSPWLSLLLSCGSMYLRGDHQSSRLYYYFSTECFDFQPTQEIKPPPSSLSSPFVPSPIYSFLFSLFLSDLCSTISLLSP